MKKLILFIPLLLLIAVNLTAQETKKKVEKKVVIIKETKDEKGKVVKERIEAEGEEAEALIKKMKEEESGVEKEVEVIIREAMKGNSSEVMGERKVNVEVIKGDGEDGHMIIKMKDDGSSEEKMMKFHLKDGKIPAEVQEKLDELGIDIHMDESEGNKMIKIEEFKSGNGDYNTGNFFIELDKDKGGKARVKSWRSEDGNMTPEMEELIKSGKIKMIFKGEDGEEVNLFDSEDPLPEVKVRLGVRLSDNNGVIIERFEGNSVLEGAGLESGDQITEINDFYIADYKGLLNELAKYNPGDKVSIRYIREGKAQTVNVKLAGKE
jgi:type II secretory pathway component PulC